MRTGGERETEDEMVGWHHQLNRQNLSKLWEMVKDRESWHAAVNGVAKSWTIYKGVLAIKRNTFESVLMR